MTTANLADGRKLNFPDGTDPTVIQATVKRVLGGDIGLPAPPAPTTDPAAPTGGTGFELRGVDKTLAAFGEGVKEAAGNVPKSAGRFIEDLVTPFLEPRETAAAIGNLALGTVQKIIPGEQDKEVFADQMVQFIKERYGSFDAFKQTLVEDPVGAVADLAGVVTAAGAAVRTVGAVSKVKKISDVGRAITGAGAAMEPLSIARKAGAGAARQFIPRELPGNLYQSAVKFSTTLTEKQRGTLVRTALDNKIMPTVNGLTKIRTVINELNDKITKLIDDATESGQKIPMKRLFKDFDALNKEALLSGKPISNLKEIANIRKQIFEANRKIGRGSFTPKSCRH